MKNNYQCVVVGAGIAGMTAAIYLKRAGVNVLLLDNDAPGGLLNKITVVENYPGYKEISGPDLAYQIYEQVQHLKIEMRYGQVLDIQDHVIKTDVEEIIAEKIIIATGRKARKLKQTENLKNVSYCALCDGNLYKNKIVAVVGGGNAALEEALYLADICEKVILLNRSSLLRGEEELQKRVKNHKNIELKLNCVINTINSQDNVIQSIETTEGNINIDGLFVSIGYEPNMTFLQDLKKENGYIIVNEQMKTNIDYIFACGDSIKKDVYQLTTAVGEATIAAIQVKKELMN